MRNKNTRIYSDFDFNFKPHPLTGDVQMKFNEESIKRAVFNLIMLNTYDKPLRPEISSNIRNLLFEPMTQGTSLALRSRIEFILKQFEPRIKLEDTDITADYENNQYNILLRYTILNTLNSVEQRLFLERVR